MANKHSDTTRYSALERNFQIIEFQISYEEFNFLPRNPIYKFEYVDGRAVLVPRPKVRHVSISTESTADNDKSLLDTHCIDARNLEIQPLAESDLNLLSPAFASAFTNVPPFTGLTVEKRREIATEALAEVATEQNGPMIHDACCVAMTTNNKPIGACIVTEPTASSDYPNWMNSQPHLTWIFTDFLNTRRGLGTAMLHHALNALNTSGRHTLYSTFMLGNHASTLWHWECGFELVGSPHSLRGRNVTP